MFWGSRISGPPSWNSYLYATQLKFRQFVQCPQFWYYFSVKIALFTPVILTIIFSIANESALVPEAVSYWSIILIGFYSWIILISKDAQGYLGLESNTVFTVSIHCKYSMNFYWYKTSLLKEIRRETSFLKHLLYWQIPGKGHFVKNTNFALPSHFHHQSFHMPLFLIFWL